MHDKQPNAQSNAQDNTQRIAQSNAQSHAQPLSTRTHPNTQPNEQLKAHRNSQLNAQAMQKGIGNLKMNTMTKLGSPSSTSAIFEITNKLNGFMPEPMMNHVPKQNRTPYGKPKAVS